MSFRLFNKLELVNAPKDLDWNQKFKIEYIAEADLEKIFEIEIEDDNIWDANIEFAIYKGPDGFGLYHKIPDGYSSYTYDPDVTERYYQNCDWDWFFNFGLDQEQRDLLNGFKP